MRSLLFLLVIIALSCKTKQPGSETANKEDQFRIEVEAIRNRMPMSSGGTYFIITISPADSLMKEKFRMTELVVAGKSTSWKTTKFDHSDYSPTPQGYQNVARDFDQSLEGPYKFNLTIEFESGKKEVWEADKVTWQTVY